MGHRGGGGEIGPPRGRVAAAIIGLLCLVWGSTWLVIREGLADLPPMTSAAARFVVAGLVFVAIAPWLRVREGGDDPPLWLSICTGLLNFAIPYAIVYWGETVIPSSLASLLWAVFPMMMALIAHFALPGERLTPTHAAGFAVGFLGVLLLFATDLRSIGPRALGMGAIFLLSPTISAVGNTVVKKHGGRVSSALLTRNGLVVSAIALAAAALVAERGATVRWTPSAIASVAYLALVGTVITFGLYFWLLRSVPAGRLSLIAYVIPAVALFLGFTVGDEPVGLDTLAGAALILLGVSLAARRGRTSGRPAEDAGARA